MPTTNPLLLDIPTTLETARLQLRTPQRGDGPLLYEAVAESLPELRRFIASLPWVAEEPSVQASELYCRNASAQVLARKDLPYLLFERASGRLVGSAGLHHPNWDLPQFEVGYWCRSPMAGCGYVSEAVAALVQLAEQTLGAVRLELITDEENQASRAVASRCGFTLEGLLHNERRAPGGGLRHTCLYARIRREPAVVPLAADAGLPATRLAACSCGQLQARVAGAPQRVSVCHCLACQRRTGSVFGAQARFQRADVAIRGQSQTWVRQGDEGSRIQFHFCPHCGATVYYVAEDQPESVAIPVGAFADPGFQPPTCSVYEERMHRWVGLPADVEHMA